MSAKRYSIIATDPQHLTENFEYEDYRSALKYYKQLLKSQKFDEVQLIELTVENIMEWHKY